MYSTPGISHSSFSIGLVTRSSTSRAEAPGICTNTSTMGTTICGSSSRGSFQNGEEPEQDGGADDQRCELGVDPGVGEPSGRAEFTGPRSLNQPPRANRLRGLAGRGRSPVSPALRPERTSARSSSFAPRVTKRVRAAPFSATKTDCSCPCSMTAAMGMVMDLRFVAEAKRARPKVPDLSGTAAGRSIFTVPARAAASTSGTISETLPG